MAEYQRIDARIFGGTTPGQYAVPGENPLSPPKVPLAAPVAAAEAATGSTMEAVGDAALAAVNRVPSTAWEATKAAASEWLPQKMYKAYQAPEFDWEEGHNPVEMLNMVPYGLSQEQADYLIKTKSPAEFNFKLDNIKETIDASGVMSDHSALSMAITMIDPAFLAISVASGGAGFVAKAAQLGRGAKVAAGATGFGTTLAMGRAQQAVEPVSDAYVWGQALAFGAAEGLLYKAGKLTQADPTFPGTKLTTIAQDIAEGKAGKSALPDTHPDFVGPIQPTAAPLFEPRVPATGEGRTPTRYGPGGIPEVSDYNPNLPLTRDQQRAITQVRTVDDLTNIVASVRLGRTEIDKAAKAVYLPAEDRVFLIMDNIKPTDDLKGIVLHEYGVHMYAERVLGTETLGKVLTNLEDRALAGEARAKQAFADVPRDTPRHLVREEALGYYVERNHAMVGDNIVSRMISGVKELLRKTGLRSLKYSESDIINLVRKAARGGEKAPARSFDTAFPYAWHGGPVSGIDKLDTAFMGTGEGNKAFGWGHYVTMEKGTGLDYRNKEATRRGLNPDQGGLYRVKINAEQRQFLDLDARAQSPLVQAALTKFGVRDGVTGYTAYGWLTKKFGSDKAASEALYAEGVVGNRYATGRTRKSDVQNSNYVLFHNDAVDIAARYSKPIAPVPGAAAKEAKSAMGRKLEWSLRKSLAKFNDTWKGISEVLVDDALDMSGDSVASQSRGIRADLAQPQYVYEDLLSKQLAAQKFGVFNRIKNYREGVKAQQQVEKRTYLEMLRRDDQYASGLPISHVGVAPETKAMADALDVTYASAAGEMTRAGVYGAEELKPRSGFLPRRWDITKMEVGINRLMAEGATKEAAEQQLRDALSIGLQRKNGWGTELSGDVAKSIYDRARSNGYFEDSAFRMGADTDGLAEVRDLMSKAGIPEARIARALEKLAGVVDEAGKISTLKHRVPMSLDEHIVFADGSKMHLHDMLDTNVTTLTERYLDRAAAQSAFARKGMPKATDIMALRKKGLESIADPVQRAEAKDLFDNTIAALRGDPVGEKLPDFMRNTLAYTQMIGLANSALFQVTEYATMMAHYGGGAVVKNMFKELPFVRGILSDPAEAGHLRNVLHRNASQDMRIRPFIAKMEDNFDIPISNSIQLAMQQAKQLVPYVNGLKFVQGHQARVAGNLIVNTFERGVKGDAKALAALEHYGLELHTVAKIQGDIAQHGMDTHKWSASTWDAVRGPLTKMVDDAVLRSRTGEIPAFAQFSSTGKFIFTFRSFVLGAHNKVLAGTLHKGGAGGMALVLGYQLPLAYMVTATQNAVNGKQMTEEQTLGQALGQAGSMGLLSEAVGVVFGTKQQFGSPGTIAWDKVYKMTGSVADGDFKEAGITGMGSVPLLGSFLPLKALGAHLKEDKKEK